MEQSEAVPVFDYPVISDDAVPAGKTLEEAGPGDRVCHDERVWRCGEDNEKLGDPIGWVTICEDVTTRPGRRSYTATFDLKGFDAIEVSGMVPGDGSWIGKGNGNARGHGRTGTVPVEGWNPKRWG